MASTRKYPSAPLSYSRSRVGWQTIGNGIVTGRGERERERKIRPWIGSPNWNQLLFFSIGSISARKRPFVWPLFYSQIYQHYCASCRLTVHRKHTPNKTLNYKWTDWKLTVESWDLFSIWIALSWFPLNLITFILDHSCCLLSFE